MSAIIAKSLKLGKESNSNLLPNQSQLVSIDLPEKSNIGAKVLLVSFVTSGYLVF